MTIEISADNPYTAWAFNVIDEYKSLTVEQIKEEVAKKSLPFAVCMQHIQYDNNIAAVIRSANAFGARKVFYFGKKKYDKRAAAGVYNYTPVSFLDSIEALKDLKKDYTFVGLDNIPEKNPTSVSKFVWKPNTLMIVGSESMGLVPEVLDLCDHFVQIEQRGSVRSLNAATAASIAMYDYCSKYNGKLHD